MAQPNPRQNVADLTAIRDDLEKAAQESHQSLYGLLDQFAEQIQADAQAMAPVDTGLLKESIRITRFTDRIEIGVDEQIVDYAGFQEYGTRGPYKITAKQKKALAFKVAGKTVIVKSVMHPGVKAHPYIRPALGKFLDRLGPAAAEVGVQLIESRNP
jgi:HK97 gp10 family phage protein